MLNYELLFVIGLMLIAFFYSSVGHGGASGYLALGALMGLPQQEMRVPALLMNMVVSAIAFVIRHDGPRYAGRLPDERVADYMASACGYAGSAAEYLLHTWETAERVGVGDRYLRRMQGLVAQRLMALRDARRA